MFRLAVAFLTAAPISACVPADPPRSDQTDAASAPTLAVTNAEPRREEPGQVLPPPQPIDPLERTQPARATPAAPTGPAEPIRQTYTDGFNRSELGPDWQTTSSVWRLQGGRLCVRGARNHPLWLRRALPENARIEFDALSRSSDGDIKVEAWGDGKSAATSVSYTATSYVFIFGGWRNSYHVLAKQDEHAKDRLEIRVDPSGSDYRARPVDPNHLYHFKIERQAGVIRWLVDDIELHVFRDPAPLKGPAHEYFAFNNWEVPICFDNLEITPLGS